MDKQETWLESLKKGAHRHRYAREAVVTHEGDTTIETYPCRCGARKVVRTHHPPVRHGVCPDCGGTVVYDPTRPKTYVGTDVYCDENVYGEWYCTQCYRAGDEDFSGDFEPAAVVETLFLDAERREHVMH